MKIGLKEGRVDAGGPDLTDFKRMTDKIMGAVSAEFDSKMGIFQEYEDRIVGLMEEHVRMRSGLVVIRDGASRSLVGGGEIRSESESSRNPLPNSNNNDNKYEDRFGSRPRIIGNEQLVPPRTPGSMVGTRMEASSTEASGGEHMDG